MGTRVVTREGAEALERRGEWPGNRRVVASQSNLCKKILRGEVAIMLGPNRKKSGNAEYVGPRTSMRELTAGGWQRLDGVSVKEGPKRRRGV